MPDERTEKMKAVDLAMSQIEKQFGKGAIMRMGGVDPNAVMDAVPSGSLSLDAALGVAGYREDASSRSSDRNPRGKTTLSIHAIAEAQKLGGTAASSTRNTRLTQTTPANSASISTTCWCPARQRRTGSRMPKS